MKIHTPLISVKDQLIEFIAQGYAISGYALANRHDENIVQNKKIWTKAVATYLQKIFPTSKETGQFLYQTHLEYGFTDMNKNVADVVNATNAQINTLEHVLDTLEKFYQFEPDSRRLFIQHIDSFSLVRDINYAQIKEYLENGSFYREHEKVIKHAFAQIIGESFVPNDHGGETEDIFTSRFMLNGQRVQASVILNGIGKVSAKETRTKDLGAQGDQLERMMRTYSSQLYVLQSVKPVGQDIVNTFEVFIESQRSKGNHCYYCIIDGQDTATILYAYGYLRQKENIMNAE